MAAYKHTHKAQYDHRSQLAVLDVVGLRVAAGRIDSLPQHAAIAGRSYGWPRVVCSLKLFMCGDSGRKQRRKIVVSNNPIDVKSLLDRCFSLTQV